MPTEPDSKRVALLHAYSARNAGDGLLVTEALTFIRERHGENAAIDVFALRPETFHGLGVVVIDARPRWFGYDRRYLNRLRSLGRYDELYGVGGGYLRFGHPIEALKTLIVHIPQIIAASAAGATIYLPQSIGPVPRPFRPLLRRALRSARAVHLRDDRSVWEVGGRNTVRTPDMALLTSTYRPRRRAAPMDIPVISIRELRGRVPDSFRALAGLYDRFDGYVQSTTGGNDDSSAVDSIAPARVLSKEELLDGEDVRVVIAVRLHAALMALNAGHYVVHLAYERKGFGAFQDLGLPEFVHNAFDFDLDQVESQVRELMTSNQAREDYDARVDAARSRLATDRAELLTVRTDLPKIGVVIPTLGDRLSIERIIRSALDQRLAPTEIVVVVQGDDRAVREIAAGLPTRVPVTIVQSERGLSRARNAGIELLSPDIEVVATPDDDVWYAPDAFVNAAEVFRADDFVGAMSGAARWPNKATGRLRFGGAPLVLSRRSVWKTSIEPAMFYRRSVIEAAGLFDVDLGLGARTPWQSGEGTDLLLRIMAAEHKVAYRPEVVVFEEDPSPAGLSDRVDRARKYGRGTGRVYAMRLGLLDQAVLIGKSVFLAIVRFRRPEGAVARAVLRGRIEGITGRLRA